MAQMTKPPATTGTTVPVGRSTPPWQPFESLHQQINRLFEDFERGSWPSALRIAGLHESPWSRILTGNGGPAVNVAETDKSYEITAELPGVDEKNLEVMLVNGSLTIKGEKQDEKQENNKDYHLLERHFGLFERSFQLPDGVDAEKIVATFSKGVLKVALPKKPEAQKPEKKISVKRVD